jgi:transcriptional regulator with XRE-family HTH domain
MPRPFLLVAADVSVYDYGRDGTGSDWRCQRLKTLASTPGDLGERIRQARSARGWSLTEAARRTGLSRAYINALELGKGKRPGADAVRRLEDVFGPLTPAPELPPHDLPPGLRLLGEERRLPASELRLLAGLRIRGQQPQSVDRWRFIYDALVASESFDGPLVAK